MGQIHNFEFVNFFLLELLSQLLSQLLLASTQLIKKNVQMECSFCYHEKDAFGGTEEHTQRERQKKGSFMTCDKQEVTCILPTSICIHFYFFFLFYCIVHIFPPPRSNLQSSIGFMLQNNYYFIYVCSMHKTQRSIFNYCTYTFDLLLIIEHEKNGQQIELFMK